MAALNAPAKIWHNGQIKPWAEATVHVMTHALHYGSSVFEGIRAYDTPSGTAIFRLGDHIQRLYDSAKIYRMEIPYTHHEIESACKEIVRTNGLKSAYLRPLAYVGYGGIGIVPDAETPIDLVVAAFEWGAYLGAGTQETGVDVGVSSWHRLAPNTMPTGAKAGGNYLSGALIAREARRHGYHEGLALDHNNMVSEGAGQNVFLVKNKTIFTPPLTASILPGITRDTVMVLAKELGYQVREENIAREALYVADEMFLCGTASEIVPVKTVDGLKVGAGRRGPVTEAIQKKFFGLFNGQTPDIWGWLDPVENPTSAFVHAAYA